LGSFTTVLQLFTPSAEFATYRYRDAFKKAVIVSVSVKVLHFLRSALPAEAACIDFEVNIALGGPGLN
jgi:hypothetical protein